MKRVTVFVILFLYTHTNWVIICPRALFLRAFQQFSIYYHYARFYRKLFDWLFEAALRTSGPINIG